MTDSEGYKYLPAFVEKMAKEHLSPQVIDLFIHYYKKAILGETGLLHEKDIKALPLKEVKGFESITEYAAAGKAALKDTVAITLNGGLGTNMGLKGPKSLLTAKNGKTFLEIILQHTRQQGVEMAFMNSFSTHEDTMAAIEKIMPDFSPSYFLQNKFPKILQSDFSPAAWPQNPDLEWNPPGHGDLFLALNTSGLLDQLIKNGIQYAFVFNCDNLGACIEESLLGYFAENNFPFMMEVATRTPSDMKGGHLAKHKDGYLLLRESAQCPNGEQSAFSDIGNYCFFNTNNLWINLPALHSYLKTHDVMKLPMILNAKTLDPRDPNSPPVFQVESAMGSAISLFPEATVIRVPRTRFFPVKKCSDLLAIRSDYFLLSTDNRLVQNPDRTTDNLKISLDPVYYGKIDEFDERFKQGTPSLMHCSELHVSGNVYFEKEVTILGKIKIKNSSGTPKTIKAGTTVSSDLTF